MDRLGLDPEYHLVDVIARHLGAVGEFRRQEMCARCKLVARDPVELGLSEMAEARALGHATGRVDQNPHLYYRFLPPDEHIPRKITGAEPTRCVRRPNSPDNLVVDIGIDAPVAQGIAAALVEGLNRFEERSG